MAQPSSLFCACHSDVEWCHLVRRMLSEGYGVEDIALATYRPTEAVRNEITLMRAEGALIPLFVAPEASTPTHSPKFEDTGASNGRRSKGVFAMPVMK